MKENYEFSVGLRNIEDAIFIRTNFMPLAINDEKWNLVISESHKIIELLLGGLIILLGSDPEQRKHNLEGLVQKFESSLTETEGNIPFAAGYYDKDGNCYGLGINENSIKILRKINNSYTVLLSMPHQTKYLEKNTDIKLEIDGAYITVRVDGETLAQHVDTSLTGTMIHIRREINIKPRSGRFLELKKIGQIFTHALLMDARYSKRVFSKEEALKVKIDMDKIYEISKNMVSVAL